MKRLTCMLLLLLSGCASAAPQAASAPTAPAPTVAPSPTAAPSPTRELRLSFDLREQDPVLGTRSAPFWNQLFMDPGGVVFHDGRLHMFYNGIQRWPSPVGVGYATSEDGITWTEHASEPLFTIADVPHAAPEPLNNLFVSSALVEPDGTWVLYFYEMAGADFNAYQAIGRATAPTPTGPWTVDPEPALTPGPQEAWDSEQVSSPWVVRTEQGYLMYYDGKHGSTSMIGLATSADGVRWVKHNDPATSDARFAASDPVLQVSAGGWDDVRVVDPNVIPIPGGWLMAYASSHGSGKFNGGPYEVGLATSPDGIVWTKQGDGPALSSADNPVLRATYLSTLVQHQDTLYLYLDIPIKGGTKIFLATAPAPLP